MVDFHVLPAFLALILLFLLPPGPDMAYMLAVGLEGGRGAAVRAIVGIGTGMTMYASGVVFGLGKLARAHPGALDVVKCVGAAYLVLLAVTPVRSARAETSAPAQPAVGRWYLRGFSVAATNPKIILFYVTVLPGFTGTAENAVAQLAMLGAVNVVSEVVLYGGIGVLAGVLHARFASAHRGQSTLKYVAGAVYLALAAVITVETLST